MDKNGALSNKGQSGVSIHMLMVPAYINTKDSFEIQLSSEQRWGWGTHYLPSQKFTYKF